MLFHKNENRGYLSNGKKLTSPLIVKKSTLKREMQTGPHSSPRHQYYFSTISFDGPFLNFHPKNSQ